jgi:Signal transduction histidine kinase involved in nitrogen fixation and metabolism regulation
LVNRLRAKDYLNLTVKESEKVQSSFVSDLNGNIILSTNSELEDTNISENFYFNSSLEGNTVITEWTDKNKALNKMAIAATPIYNGDGKIIGILGNILDQAYLKSNVLNNRVDRTGYFYLSNSDGIIISHPDDSRIGQPVENDKLRKLLENDNFIYFEGTKIDLYNYRGKDKIMAYRIIPAVNWILVTTQELGEVRQSALSIFIIIMLATVLLTVFSTMISRRVSRSITKPIEEMMNSMQLAAKGDLSVQCNITSRDELGSLSTNFNIMVSKLNLSYEELTALYEQLAAAEEELRTQYEELQSSEEALRDSEDRYRLALESA